MHQYPLFCILCYYFIICVYQFLFVFQNFVHFTTIPPFCFEAEHCKYVTRRFEAERYVFTMLRIDWNGRSSCEMERILLRGLCTSQLHIVITPSEVELIMVLRFYCTEPDTLNVIEILMWCYMLMDLWILWKSLFTPYYPLTSHVSVMGYCVPLKSN